MREELPAPVRVAVFVSSVALLPTRKVVSTNDEGRMRLESYHLRKTVSGESRGTKGDSGATRAFSADL